MNNLDKLFEKKLADHALMPSASAWENLEARLSKKNKPLKWIRWAAVFLLGGLVLGVFWLKNHEPQPALAQESVQQPAAVEELKQEPIAVRQTTTTVQAKKKIKSIASPAQQSLVSNPIPIENDKEIAEPVAIVELQNTEPVEKAKPAEANRSIVLVYTLDPVGVPETEHATEALTVADKKDNSLQKVMKLASEVKNSESPLGGFRDMKEELFAFDLRKKSTNKKH